MRNQTNAMETNEKHESTSEKYNHVNTLEIMHKLQQSGWKFGSSNQVQPRKLEFQGFQKHMVRMHHDGYATENERLEILIINSHQGLSSVRFMLGIYRFACANEMIVGKTFIEKRIRHIGFTHDKLNAALTELVEEAPKIFNEITAMRNIKLTCVQTLDIAEKCLRERLKNIEHVAFNAPVLSNLIRPKRQTDNNWDLYTIMNIIQEKILKGGIRYEVKKEHEDVPFAITKTNITREVKSIDQKIHLNQFVWDTAQEYLREGLICTTKKIIKNLQQK